MKFTGVSIGDDHSHHYHHSKENFKNGALVFNNLDDDIQQKYKKA